MIDIYSDNGHIKGSIELVGDTAFIGNLQHGNFPCANPKISGPYPVACNHLLSITWTIKGQYRTYGNSMEACSRIHNEPPLIPSRCAQQQVLAAGGVLAGKTPSIDSAFGAESPQAGQRPRLSAGRVKGWRLGRKALVSIPCHIEPDMRFSLIRLSDNLLPGAFKV
jgi:hypothetical protein